jgi:hypothetical protein
MIKVSSILYWPCNNRNLLRKTQISLSISISVIIRSKPGWERGGKQIKHKILSQTNEPTYFNYLQSNLRSKMDRSSPQVPQFEYDDLRATSQEIRLVRVSLSSCTRSNQRGALQLTMRTVSLTDPPPFIALSYTWGRPQLNHQVICNQQRLLVTDNLERALRNVHRRVNSSDPPTPCSANMDLWADGICINQADFEEKSSQLKLMKLIYSKARTVIAYIGAPDTTNANDAIPALFATTGIATLPLVASDNGLEWREQRQDALFELLLQPWFSRSWIFQEMILASHIICLYGDGDNYASWSLNDSMMWTTDFVKSDSVSHFYMRRETAPSSREQEKLTLNLLNIEAWRILRLKLLKNPGGLDPIDVLSWARRADATDPRDKVYSFFGLFSQDDYHALNPDYSESNTVSKTFVEFAESCILSGQSIRLLEHAGLSQKEPGLPSWVPDWTFEPRFRIDYSIYRSAGSTGSSVSLAKESGKIRVHGWIVGMVEFLGEPCSYPLGTMVLPEQRTICAEQGLIIHEFIAFLICKDLADSNDCIGGEHISDVISRTLCMDHDGTGHRCDDEHWRYYECWCTVYDASERCSRYKSTSRLTKTDPRVRHYAKVFQARACILYGRVLAMISRKFIGILPNDAVMGDVIAVFKGGRTPFVLRRVADTEEYELVGECYVHGIMDGQFSAAAVLREFAIR